MYTVELHCTSNNNIPLKDTYVIIDTTPDVHVIRHRDPKYKKGN